MEFKQFTLPNGLTFLAEEMPSAASVAVGFFVRTGSRDEQPHLNGVSHFLEHMVFKGTPRRTALDVNREFDEIGAQYNAFTTEENTVFYAAVLPEFLPRAVELLGDLLRPALREEDFLTERNVILEEIAQYEDQPHFRLYDHLTRAYFGAHPMGQRVLGTRESVGGMTPEAIREYFRRRYGAGNVTVATAGRLHWDALAGRVAAACGGWEGPEGGRSYPPMERAAGRHRVKDGKLTRQHVGMMCPAPAAQSPRRYAAGLLACILGDEVGSRLYYALIEPAIAEEATCSYDAMDQAGALITSLCCDPARAAEAVEIVRREYARFLRDGPTGEELAAAKNKIASASVLGGELPTGRMMAVGFEWVYRRSYTPLAEQIEELLAVTGEEVLAVAREGGLADGTLVTLGPRDSVGPAGSA